MRVGDVCSVHSGYTPRGRLEASLTGALAIQQADLSADGLFTPPSVIRIEAPAGKYEVGPGDVLFRSRGQHTTAWAVPDSLIEPAIAVMPLFVVRPLTDELDSRYLSWALNQPPAQQHFRQSSQGQTIQMVSKAVLQTTPISVPPIVKQRQIVAIAELAARQEWLKYRLLDREHDLLTLRLFHAAQFDSKSEHQNRTIR